MDALFSQLSVLANEALDSKSFDPSAIEELLELFEMEACASCAAAESEHLRSVREAEAAMKDAEDYLNSIIDASSATLQMGDALGSAAEGASEKYMEAALASAMASMKAAFARSKKIHP